MIIHDLLHLFHAHTSSDNGTLYGTPAESCTLDTILTELRYNVNLNIILFKGLFRDADTLQKKRAMNPKNVVREKTKALTDLPNIGNSLAADLERIGIHSPEKLEGKDPYALYQKLCKVTGKRQDPCVLDIFISIIDFMNGGEPRVWWDYTAERKKKYKL